jgi:3'(2'), 5'-bisphosphate nucleotidase
VQRRQGEVRQITKDDRSPVTVADYAAQAIVAMSILEDDPSALITGEEHSGDLRRPEHRTLLGAVVDAVRLARPEAGEDDVLAAIDRCDHDATAPAFWAIDPIDGTKGFLRGQQYAIALGRIEEGVVTLGVMGCPNLPVDATEPLDRAAADGSIYAAARGRGAWEMRAGAPVARARRIVAARDAGDRPIRVCESVEAEHTKHSDTARILETLGARSTPVRLDSQCKYAVVARGQADAYLRLPSRKGYVEKIWDHAAGSLIAAEAGAVVSDVTGAPLDFTHGRSLVVNRGIVCTAAGLHSRVIDAIRQLGLAAPV